MDVMPTKTVTFTADGFDFGAIEPLFSKLVEELAKRDGARVVRKVVREEGRKIELTLTTDPAPDAENRLQRILDSVFDRVVKISRDARDACGGDS